MIIGVIRKSWEPRQTSGMLESLSPPHHFFASDNNATVHPAVIDALQSVNVGHAIAYGDDVHTKHAEQMFNELFGRRVDTLFVWNGTGANVLALACALRPAGAVVCTSCAHINVDETGAPERFLGAKLIDLAHHNGKLLPEQLKSLTHDLGVVHHVQPSVLSLTQSTEWGSVYTHDEIGALCDTAHSMGMYVHVDGARLANAIAAVGGSSATLQTMLVDTGVDVVSFGGTKNGLMYGEAVVFLDRTLSTHAPFVRKQVTQLPSKVRYIAAQFSALFENDLWLTNARLANEMTMTVYKRVKDIPGIRVESPVVNSLYPVVPMEIREPLREWSFFYDWDPSRDQVRWMTAWDTTLEDVERLEAALRWLADQSTS